jgi:hypothetical protein
MPTTAASNTFAVTATDTTTVGNGGQFTGTKVYTVQVGTPQTITFATLVNQAYNVVTPQALTASSNATPTIPVTFAASPSSVCTVAGSTLTYLPAGGTCTVTASAAGTPTYLPATQTQSFIVGTAPGAPTIGSAVAGPATQQATVNFTAPANTGGVAITSYTATASPGGATGTCTASPCAVGSLANGVSYQFMVKATNAVNLVGADSALSNAVTPELGQVITFANPGAQNTGTSPTLTATTTGTSGQPITFASSTFGVCTVTAAGQLTLVSLGTCTITASQAGDATHNPAAPVTQSFMVQVATPTVTITSSANPSVAGQPLTFTAALTAPVTTTGTVTWSVNSAAGVGTASAISATGTATFTPSPALAVGSYAVKATYVPAAGDTGHVTNTSPTFTQVVNKASTTTAVTVSGNTLTATVHPVAPSTGTPTGTVAFTVGGVPAGTGTIGAAGIATVTGANVGSQSVIATYSGDTSYLTSTGSRSAVVNPTVTAVVTSIHSKSQYGWYHAPVRVIFTCTQGSAPLSAACPGSVKLSTNTAGRTVTRTITATDGGIGTVTSSKIKIDGTAPKLTVKRTGHTLKCHGSDSLSGLASCKITKHSKTKNGVKTVTWSATATDKAGNKTKKHGHFSYSV